MTKPINERFIRTACFPPTPSPCTLHPSVGQNILLLLLLVRAPSRRRRPNQSRRVDYRIECVPRGNNKRRQRVVLASVPSGSACYFFFFFAFLRD